MRFVLLTFAVLAFAAVPAVAQGPPLDTYGGAGGVVGGVDTPADVGAGGVGGIQDEPAGGVGGIQDEPAGGVGGIQDEPAGGVGGIQDEPAGGVGGIVEERGATARGDGGGGSLPFTGLDLALLAVGGMVLLGMGVGMRQLSRSLA